MILGRPVGLPTIDATGTFRAFTVYAEGSLDLRFVRIFRGHPMEYIQPMLYIEIRGGAVWIKSGGIGKSHIWRRRLVI